ncbi:H-NS histone family protein [Alteromonas aestuariivivens]|uniref:DNA-binding protein n=1 Tax=Alteromonas aestuariivivens TaxID=1938339 RepID=A0A3D8MAT2_9ALTE|nr:H-NS family nucleoid-associated regulatory protein [Alteromonas aestuariivivens]RDV27390.1 H-NS histone family protein [Alteromonas aestuariivivens]
MNDFLDILTHGRRLQGAVKDLSISELEAVQDKLTNIIEKRKEKEIEKQKEEQAKLQKIADIQKQLAEAGLDLNDLKAIGGESVKKRVTGKKRPVKYQITDESGKEHPWTGIGRMPKVFKNALEQGKNLEDFAI